MDVDTAAIAVAAFNGDNKLFFSSFRLCCCSVVKRSARVSSEDILMCERVLMCIFYDDKALSRYKKENRRGRTRYIKREIQKKGKKFIFLSKVLSRCLKK